MSERLKALEARLKAVKKEIREIASDGNYCKRCCSTDVYWMTLSEISSKPILFNNSGGRHDCTQPNPDDFQEVTE